MILSDQNETSNSQLLPNISHNNTCSTSLHLKNRSKNSIKILKSYYNKDAHASVTNTFIDNPSAGNNNGFISKNDYK